MGDDPGPARLLSRKCRPESPDGVDERAAQQRLLWGASVRVPGVGGERRLSASCVNDFRHVPDERFGSGHTLPPWGLEQ